MPIPSGNRYFDAKLSTRALESGGNLAAILAQLDVDLSTRARLQPWYQANFSTTHQYYVDYNIGPHAFTTRFTYTVPTSRLAILMSASLTFMRRTAPTTAGEAFARTFVGALTPVLTLIEQTSTVGGCVTQSIGQGAIVEAAENIFTQSADQSTGGTYHWALGSSITEFDV